VNEEDTSETDNETSKRRTPKRTASKSKKVIKDTSSESEYEPEGENPTESDYEPEEENISDEVEDEIKEIISDEECEQDLNSSSISTKSRPKRTKKEKHQDESFRSEVKQIDEFNLETKVSEWEYEPEPNCKLYCRPILPALSDLAIKPFLNSKSTKKSTIYDCPFCHIHFTYNLVFKTHLFSCSKNPNVPE